MVKIMKDINMLLIRFLMRLHKNVVTIELKNDTTIEGTVDSVDVAMNFHLTSVNVTLKDEKDPIHVDAVSVRGNSIRCIIFPDNMNLDKLMIDVPQVQKKRDKTSGQVHGQNVAARGGRGRSSGRVF
ncbi:putative small nuclear ribonucleoprotein Sm [Dirofilaria immitis]